MRNFDQTLVRR